MISRALKVSVHKTFSDKNNLISNGKKLSRKLSKVNYFHLNNAQSKLCFYFFIYFHLFLSPDTQSFTGSKASAAPVAWVAE